jgi:signal transduction histidine kinase/ActR/RegA family two-component response regulator
MGERVRAFDWRSTPLGDASRWPASLKTLVALLLASKQPMFLAWGPERTWIYNDAFIPILGLKHPDALGRPGMDVWSEARGLLEPLFDRVYAGEPVSIEDFTLPLDRYGRLEDAHFEFAYTPARCADGKVAGLFGSCIETTARVLAERAQAMAAEQQRRQFQSAPGFIAVLSGPDHVFDFVNDAYVALVGGDRELLGKPVREVLPEVADQGFFELLDEVYTSGHRHVSRRTPVRLQRMVGAPLDERFLDFIYAPIFGEGGRTTGIFVEGFDATEAHLAQEAARVLNETLEQRVETRTRELEAAQNALVHAQKIEAIGRLTGGVAHDFNNLLMVIIGGLSMIDRPGEPERRQRVLDGMRLAAERGASLSRQLLAFARRQPLSPQPVQLANQLASMQELLDRTLRGDVHVFNELAPDLWNVLVDPTELELVMLNLCVNARDAMPGGGAIVIRAENASDAGPAGLKGEFVRLSVSDNGTGMPPDVVARVFEPFFTTKEIGKGSGLGLAHVHGFAQQSGGAVEVQSRPGEGTTVSLWLPRTHEPVAAMKEAVDVRAAAPKSAGSVLLVEDDPEVARLVTEMLGELGYGVTHAASPEAALGALANERRVDLLFSDIMMPGPLDGLDLVHEARRRRPGLPVLLTSGYAEAAIRNATQEGIPLLAKPYDIRALAEALDRVLGRA